MRRRRTKLRGALAAIAAVFAIALPATASARDVMVTSFDGTQISAHFFPAAGLGAGQQAPTVMVGPGWSMSGETNPDSASNPVLENFGLTPIGAFHNRGYNVLTWDPRGFGASGGTVQVDDYRFEGKDAQALIDYIAQQPESQMESPGDPLLGMAGSSYGGIIQLVTAAIDSRVDAIVPNITPHDLTSSLFKERAVKAGWGLLLIGAGLEGATLPGLIGNPPQTGGLDPHIVDTIGAGLLDNSVTDANYNWFAEKGPGFLVKDIHVPTLLTQGTADTLFTPQEAIENFNDLAAHSGAPLKMMWFCGGHGVCITPSGPSGYLLGRTIGWLDRYLKGDSSVDTGPRFEWLADDGVWRGAADYPLKQVGALSAQGAAAMPITPLQTSGSLILATPLPVPGLAATLPIPGPSQPADIVGAPQLTLTYTGTAVTKPQTHVYAQIADPQNLRVLGNQATPIPLTLDGTPHTITRPLEPIAARAAAGHGYELELVPSSNLYGAQTTLGLVNFTDMKVGLPVVDGAGTPPPAQAGVAGVAGHRKHAKHRRSAAAKRRKCRAKAPKTKTKKAKRRRAKKCRRPRR